MNQFEENLNEVGIPSKVIQGHVHETNSLFCLESNSISLKMNTIFSFFFLERFCDFLFLIRILSKLFMDAIVMEDTHFYKDVFVL